jgi:O-glycosyl hydrolase
MVKGVVCIIFMTVLAGQHLFSQLVTFTIDLKATAQTIANIGASGAWFSEGIGKYWPEAKKERIAELLFSQNFDKSGNPLGIGLSAWRFNIGGGTDEQGDSSGIDNPVKRVECFLSPDGTFDWNKQKGYMWFTKKAASYGVQDLIAFSNTPPVQYTKNGLGFKTVKDYQTNLAEDKYAAYASFLANVVQHFDQEGIHFRFISPVNEPQWDWSGKFGHMSQEGSPWKNEDIFKIVLSLDSALASKKLSSKILITEAGLLTSLYEGRSYASRQIQSFFDPESSLFLGNLKHLDPVIEGHGYFTDFSDTSIISVRQKLRDTAANNHVHFWQSEYCLLSNGYNEGVKGKIAAMDCALFLAKIIYHDLAVAQASAWHFWNSFEPGSADFDCRYYLIALKNNSLNTEGDFTVTKNLWALGHFSRFIRPGMHRVITSRSDRLSNVQAAKDIMLVAFANAEHIVVTVINYAYQQKEIKLALGGVNSIKSIRQYVTTGSEDDNMKYYPVASIKKLLVRPRSIVTLVIDVNPTKGKQKGE